MQEENVKAYIDQIIAESRENLSLRALGERGKLRRKNLKALDALYEMVDQTNAIVDQVFPNTCRVWEERAVCVEDELLKLWRKSRERRLQQQQQQQQQDQQQHSVSPTTPTKPTPTQRVSTTPVLSIIGVRPRNTALTCATRTAS